MENSTETFETQQASLPAYSQEEQEDLSYLTNDVAIPNSISPVMVDETPTQRPYEAWSDLEKMQEDDGLRFTLKKFDPASLLSLQKINIHLEEAYSDGLLEQLISSVPVKVTYTHARLSKPLILAIHPSYNSLKNLIELKVTPYLQSINTLINY